MEQPFFLHALEPSNLSTEYPKMAVENLDWGGGARLKRMRTVGSAEFNSTPAAIMALQTHSWRNFSKPISEGAKNFTFEPKTWGGDQLEEEEEQVERESTMNAWLSV
jgi:hypothetical protein